MNIYEIIMTPDAIDDLRELRDYIADVLHAPDAALTHIRVLRTEIGTLATMPERHKCGTTNRGDRMAFVELR